MNWRVAGLDNITLISNSDAHSPSKLGREANLFKTELNYFSIRSAMEKGDKDHFAGTFEFYPEEGKYHVDGHRKCSSMLYPHSDPISQGQLPGLRKTVDTGGTSPCGRSGHTALRN
jgi:DNA helicase-2/ATP-dependent DNA helicase PcrA